MKHLLASLSLLACLLVAAAAPGTTYVRELSAKQLGDQASAVVSGKVAGVRSFWNARHTKIFTEIAVQTEQTFKGSPPAGGTVTLLQLGGVVDNVRVSVQGALAWQPGEEVLLFLEPSNPGRYQVSGFSQGKLPIERDPATGEVFVRQIPLGAQDGVQAVQPGGPEAGGQAASGTQAREKRIPLKTFLREALGERAADER